DAVGRVDARVAPVHAELRVVRASRRRTADAGLAEADHGRSSARSPRPLSGPSGSARGASARGDAGAIRTTAPGRCTVPCERPRTLLAMTTAKYGRNTAPAAGMAIHQPGTTRHRAMQTTRTDIAIVYLSMRDRRSPSGERG